LIGGAGDLATLEASIQREAEARAVVLDTTAARALALHARMVLAETPRLHLTAVDEGDLVPRHIGEAFEGAAILDPCARGLVVDLGSGNGYPGLPLAIARPGLDLLLVDASAKKADFLRRVIDACGIPRAAVLERQVQRAGDLEDLSPIDVLTVRAVGGWSRVLPRLVSRLSPTGKVLLWAGDEVERVRSRVAWRRLHIELKQALPGRERSWIWVVTGSAPPRQQDPTQ
jgi:16S rRNA (guanine527-N7)-methyltransferase